MANNKNDVLNAFSDCVDRLNAGESLEACLKTYPQFAEELRPLLNLGELVNRAQQISDAELEEAREKIRVVLLRQSQGAGLREQGQKRRFFGPSFRWYHVAGIAAVTLVAVVSTLIIGTGARQGRVFSDVASSPIANETLQLDGVYSTPTVVEHSTEVAFAPILTMTPLPTATIARMTPAIVATSVMQMSPMPTMEVNAVALTATALGILLEPAGTPTPELILPTALAGATMPPNFLSATPLPTRTQEVTPLNAGEIDDNARWDTYLQYRNNFLRQFSASVHDVNVSDRQIITVLDSRGLPVLGARVLVFFGQSLISETRTYANGQTLLLPYATGHGARGQAYRVQVEYNGAAVQFDLDVLRGPIWTVTLGAIRPVRPAQLDVVFLLDSTGSMSDEIAQLQNNILAISSQVDALSSNNLDVRYGLVTYRDRSDAYISQTTDFLSDVTTFQSILGQVQADGGGDGPESLNLGLHQAIQSLSWRGGDTVKLVFLVADAPPHLDYPDDYDYAHDMLVAAQRGIKIHPIASSGLTPDGEFIFRQLAQVTMGHFIFLTYQQSASGAPGESRPDLQVGEPANPVNQQQGDYTVERLDELVLRLITDELSAQSVAITPSGIIPPLSQAALYPEVSLPTVQLQMPTPRPYPFDVSAVPATPVPPDIPTPPVDVTTPAPSSVEPTPDWTRYIVVIGLFVLIIIGAFVIGVVLAPLLPFSRGPKRKRKNDEVEIVEPDD